MIRPVYQYPDSILREFCEPVADVFKYENLITDMIETLQKSNGLGLAANQVGASIRIIVYRSISSPGDINVLINPGIIEESGESYIEESCLSLPGYVKNIKRYAEITVIARDIEGNPLTFTEEGLSAIVLQHEIDHLDGKLFIDHLGPVAKQMFKSKWNKLQKQMKRKH